MPLNKSLEKNLDEFKVLIKKGLLHIFGGSLITKIVGFADVVVLVRILSKAEYGYWGYANNILQLVLLFAAFGAPAGILQFCSRSKDDMERLTYWKYGLSYGLKANLVLACIVFFVALRIPLAIPESRPILMSLSLLPLLMILFESITLYLRSTLRNKAFSGLSVLNSSTFFVASIVGALVFGVIGIALGRYIAMFVSIAVGIFVLRREYALFGSIPKLERKKKLEFISFSLVAMLTNSISSLLYKIDTFLVGTISRSAEAVASYQTATLIPFTLNFIPLALMTFAYPYFARHWQEKAWVNQKYWKMTKQLALVNGLISAFLFIFAPLIIRIVFGTQYLDSVVPFRVLAIGFFIAATFRIPAGNTLVAIGKIKVNLINSIISGIANIALDIVLIYQYGAIGAAVATVIVFVVSSVISVGYLIHFLGKQT